MYIIICTNQNGIYINQIFRLFKIKLNSEIIYNRRIQDKKDNTFIVLILGLPIHNIICMVFSKIHQLMFDIQIFHL